MLRFLVFLLLLNVNLDARVHNRTIRRSFVSAVFSNRTPVYSINTNNNRTGTCRWLRGLKHQNKLCRKRKGFSEVLQKARNLAVSHCKEQFESHQWNCFYLKNFTSVVFRETAFLHSLTAAALVHTIAKACSDGKLLNCRCASAYKKERLPENGRWGGCGDNVKDAKRITRRFLQLKRSGDFPSEVLKFNSEVGISTVADNDATFCACHGVSGSCALKTCYKRLQPFQTIAEKLKNAYHSAIRIAPGNQISALSALKSDKRSGILVYLEQSPDFCRTTVGRRCKDPHHCATLCCGRDHKTISEFVSKQCKCRYRQCCFDVQCDTCKEREDVNICL